MKGRVNLVTLFQLSSFCCVVEEGSFRAAAERLFVSQPSVSQHISALESHFGANLFNRQKRKVSLTPEGRLLYSSAREILDGIEDVADRISRLRSIQTGNLRTGFSPYAMSRLAPKVISSFAGNFPAVKVSVFTGEITDLEKRIGENDLEIAITERGLSHNIATSMSCHTLGYEDLVFVASPDLCLPSTLAEPNDIELLPAITCTGNNPLGPYLDDFVLQNQIKFNGRIETDNPEIAARLVAQGLGISLVARSFAESEQKEGRLKIIQMNASPPAPLEIIAIYHKTRGLTYAGWEMLKLLEISVLKELAED
ncbi:MAG TPA: LysR family transcriptional regulator [Synergistetes bacterium]|nr:LysR family transcriptional regulator [Synergistota bacterium]